SRSSERRVATGSRLYCGSGAPSGRPRCEHTITRAPALMRAFRVGNEARTRPSSVMTPSFRGTFRSQRTMTRLPSSDPNDSRVRRVMSCSETLCDVLGEVDETVGVAPLVVVPARDLDEVAADVGQLSVEDRGVRVELDVARDDRVLGVLEDSVQTTIGSGLTVR